MLYFFKIEKHTLRYDFAHVYLKSWWYDLQFLRIRVWQTKIGNYGSVFALLTPTPYPAKNPKNQNFEYMKKFLEISFYMCNNNHNHMRYSFWDRVRQTYFFVSLGHALPFYPPNKPVNQNFEKIKNTYDTRILYICTKTPDIWCLLTEIWVQHTIFCHFGSFFALSPHYWPQKLKIEKNKKIFPFWNVHNK